MSVPAKGQDSRKMHEGHLFLALKKALVSEVLLGRVVAESLLGGHRRVPPSLVAMWAHEVSLCPLSLRSQPFSTSQGQLHLKGKEFPKHPDVLPGVHNSLLNMCRDRSLQHC